MVGGHARSFMDAHMHKLIRGTRVHRIQIHTQGLKDTAHTMIVIGHVVEQIKDLQPNYVHGTIKLRTHIGF